jgi:ABC-type branched-subunit amino acid transport system substrate-binding protein
MRNAFWPMMVLSMMLLVSACAQEQGSQTVPPAPTPGAPTNDEGPAAPTGEAPREGPCAEENGITDDRILVGQIMGLSGPFAGVAEAINVGLDAYVAHINEQGGIDGRNVEIRRLDHEYSEAVAVQRFEELANEVTVLISHGTQPTNAILPDIDAACMPTLIFGQGGINALDEHAFIYGTPYAYAATNGLQWAVEEQDATGPWGIIYQGDVVGDEILQATRFAADHLGVEIVVETSFVLGDTDFTAQVRQLRESGAEWVMLAAFPPASIQIVGEAVSQGTEFGWMAPNVGWAGELTYPTEATQLMASVNLYQSNYVAGWASHDDPMLEEAKEIIGQISDVEGQLPLLGYAGGIKLIELLRQGAGAGDFSRGTLSESISRIGDVELRELFCGMTFGEQGQPHNPSRGSMILSIQEDRPPDGYVLEAPCFVGSAAEDFSLQDLDG